MNALGAAVVFLAFVALPDRALEHRFIQANDLYRAGQFEQAAEIYHSLLSEGTQSGTLHYNLGNCYYRLGKPGKALASYLRAERLMPRDSDLRRNLEFVRKELGSETAASTSLFTQTLRRWFLDYTLSEIALIAVVFHSFCFFLLAGSFLTGWRWMRRLAVVAALCLGAGIGIWIYTLSRQDAAEAVVIVPQVAARSEPSPNGKIHFTAREGTILDIASREGPWLKIVADGNKEGWVEESSVEEI